jgi:dipeptidyl aminopeptidase/acylaminoacyl peptidase
VPRPPRPDDLYRLRIATEPRLSPDGRHVAVTLQTVAPGFDGYRHALWLVPTEGREKPRQLTLGARHDRQPRFSPDGRTLAFISDRRVFVEEEPGKGGPDEKDRKPAREDRDQVYLLPLDGGEARRLTDLPRGVDAFEWSPDGTRLVVVTASYGATRTVDDRRRGIHRKAESSAGTPPPSDYRFVDRLDYMLNGSGFTFDKIGHLWLVDVATGEASRLTDGRAADGSPVW